MNKKKKNRNSNEFVIGTKLPESARALGSVLHCIAKMKPGTAKRLIQQGSVRVNGKPVRNVRARLVDGDKVEIDRPERVDHDSASSRVAGPPPRRFKPPRPSIMFRDDFVAVVFKPSGMLTVPTPRRETKTLMHWLARELKMDRRELGCVQRLDREVSGIIVVALNRAAYENLRLQFERQTPGRRYLAIVAGIMNPIQGTYSSILATTRTLGRRSVSSDSRGERAITHYRVLKQVEDAALVELWLETGRRHQIRVHFADAGNPVLGDDRYKRHKSKHPRWQADRIALHAATLSFEHPRTGETVQFQSPAPWEFNDFLEPQRQHPVPKSPGRRNPTVPKKGNNRPEKKDRDRNK